MSRSSTSRGDAQNSRGDAQNSRGDAQKPGCPHCRNLGLPHEHWLRESPEPTAKVVCPVLLATECRYCKELGHTVSGCPKKKLVNPNTRNPISYTVVNVKPITYTRAPLFCVPTSRTPMLLRNSGVLTEVHKNISNTVNAPIFTVTRLSNGSDYVARVLTAEELRSAEEFSAKLSAIYTSGISWADLEDMEF
jgi:hypothetical protein